MAATFDEAVNVKASPVPSIGMRIGEDLRDLTYTSGSDSTELVFSYTVAKFDDAQENGIWIPHSQYHETDVNDRSNIHVKNASSVTGISTGAAMSEEYEGLGYQSDQKVLRLQNPRPIEIIFETSPGDNVYYTEGDVIRIRVSYSAPLDHSRAQFWFRAHIGSKEALFQVGGPSNTNYLQATYTVEKDDFDVDGITFGRTSGTGRLRYPGSDDTIPMIKPTASRQPQQKVIGNAHITKIEMTSSPTYGDTYRLGEKMTASVHFSEPVTGARALYINFAADKEKFPIYKPEEQRYFRMWHALATDYENGDNATVTDTMLDADGISVYYAQDEQEYIGEAKPRTADDEVYISSYCESSPNLPGHKIDPEARSIVQSVSFTSTAPGDGYCADDANQTVRSDVPRIRSWTIVSTPESGPTFRNCDLISRIVQVGNAKTQNVAQRV